MGKQRRKGVNSNAMVTMQKESSALKNLYAIIVKRSRGVWWENLMHMPH